MKKETVVDVLCILLILLWAYAAISKILDYEHFSIELGKSPLLTSFPQLIAMTVPATELIIVFLLLWNQTNLSGLYASLFLLVLFTSYLIAILNFSYYIPCSCGGIIGNNLGWKAHIVFNLVFILLNTSAILLFKKSTPRELYSANISIENL